MRSKIRYEVNKKLLEIINFEKEKTRSELNKNLEYLINNRTEENEITLQFMVASKNGMRTIEAGVD